MVSFPHCKINLGLSILDRRGDGYHNLQSIFIPVNWCDALEIIPAEKDELFLYNTTLDVPPEKNICLKAVQLLRRKKDFPFVHIHLIKIIPVGAGLGGGSSNGAHTLLMLNEMFHLGFSMEQLSEFALELGSDCPFFLQKIPMWVEGRGEKLEKVFFEFKNCSIAVVFPQIHIETKFAFRLLEENRIGKTGNVFFNKEKVLKNQIEDWKNVLHNDFEDVIFPLYPEIESLKKYFFDQGATFASMSGSGSSVYGIFINQNPENLRQRLDFNNYKSSISTLNI